MMIRESNLPFVAGRKPGRPQRAIGEGAGQAAAGDQETVPRADQGVRAGEEEVSSKNSGFYVD